MTGCTALDALVEGLESEFARDPRGPKAARMLADYASTQQDWRELLLWSDERYTRNLVACTDRFELLILGWGAGQESPIHNHEGRNCWMAVLDGRMEELHYDFPSGPGPMKKLDGKVFDTGQVAFIRDEIALHLVRGYGGPGVSMHLYATPFQACNVYSPTTSRVERVQLSYHSVRGELVT